MKSLTKHAHYLSLLVMVFFGSLGCSHTPVGPPPLPAEVREQLGQIGVAYYGPVSLAVTAKPARGAGQGAGRAAGGALRGLLEHPPMDPLDIVLTPAIVGVSALVGAGLAPSAAAVAEAETVLGQAVADPPLPGTFRDRLLQALQTQRPQAVLVLSDPAADAEDEGFSPAARSQDGIETVLEVNGPTITLRKGKHAGDINPALRLSVSVSCRVRRTANHALLYTYSPEYRGDARTFTAWAADNAQPFREGVVRASEFLAQQIVAQLFGMETEKDKKGAHMP